MWIANAVIAALFVLLGILFSRGKGAFLIAGYNTASAAERARYDEKALCRFMGWVDGKMVRDADYREVLNSLKNRRLGGGRMA